jgi:hypothetical protein
MTLQTLPFALEGASAHPGPVLRNFVAAAFGAPTAAFTNAVAATTVTQNGTPNMSVNVAAGRAVVRLGNASSIVAGAGTVFNDATANVAISASDPTNPRIDLVVVEIRSSTEYGQAANDARLTVVTGTPAAVPAVPSLASFPNCLVLAQVAVAAASTTVLNAAITDKRTFAAALGGELQVTTATRPTGAALRDGLAIFDTTTHQHLRYYTGAATFRLPWSQPWGVQAYSATATPQGGIAAGPTDLTSLSVTFTAVANRYYRTSIYVADFIQSGAAGQVYMFLAENGTAVNRMAFKANAGDSFGANLQHIGAYTAGSRTHKATAGTSGGGLATSGSASEQNYIIVEDIGPVNNTPA